jgi:hypothetical protein
MDKVQLIDDVVKIKKIRNNIYSFYSRISTVYVMLLMIFVGLLTTAIAPYYLREHHIPAIFREANDNMFHTMMRIRNILYGCFIVCAGCLPQLTFFYPRDPCLHTYTEDPFGIRWTDQYYFSLVTLLWFVSVPIIIYQISTVTKDSTRFAMLPFMIASIMFVILIFIFSGTVVFYSIF